MSIDWSRYPCEGLYDELIAAPGLARPFAANLAADIAGLGGEE